LPSPPPHRSPAEHWPIIPRGTWGSGGLLQPRRKRQRLGERVEPVDRADAAARGDDQVDGGERGCAAQAKQPDWCAGLTRPASQRQHTTDDCQLEADGMGEPAVGLPAGHGLEAAHVHERPQASEHVEAALGEGERLGPQAGLAIWRRKPFARRGSRADGLVNRANTDAACLSKRCDCCV
jgi:hypothetical protein